MIHTASPFHYNFTDPVTEILEPAIKGTTGILKAIKAYAPSVKRVVITSSFAAITNAPNHLKLYDESVWNPVTWEDAVKDDKFTTYRGSKVQTTVFAISCCAVGQEKDSNVGNRHWPKKQLGIS